MVGGFGWLSDIIGWSRVLLVHLTFYNVCRSMSAYGNKKMYVLIAVLGYRYGTDCYMGGGRLILYLYLYIFVAILVTNL